MTILGLPLSRSSAMWRRAGLSYEQAISLHRALGHLMMTLLAVHSRATHGALPHPCTFH